MSCFNFEQQVAHIANDFCSVIELMIPDVELIKRILFTLIVDHFADDVDSSEIT